ncbi:hypothetical protein EX30DRAFT_341225 [Ascodesmis nigricans]|uniref:Uncharacterized protein n=1 Tax=Ascodesmis nigricans TaxID=341454 RepID=A0A4S2MW87_9PEZI|nr:hypothetical protein EX30DRAFT_341225 [Ascodesmis nigricans]
MPSKPSITLALGTTGFFLFFAAFPSVVLGVLSLVGVCALCYIAMFGIGFDEDDGEQEEGGGVRRGH